MVTTVRFPQGLKDRASVYADGLGISLNALVAVALRDYLDSRDQVAAVPVLASREVLEDLVEGASRQQRRAAERAEKKGKGKGNG